MLSVIFTPEIKSEITQHKIILFALASITAYKHIKPEVFGLCHLM